MANSFMFLQTGRNHSRLLCGRRRSVARAQARDRPRAGHREYQIADIGMRMLTARELFRAQGFPDTYIIDPVITYQTESGRWKTGRMPNTMQVEMCGNSVAPPIAAALAASVLSFAPAAAAA